MKIFINDIPVRIIDKAEAKDPSEYDLIIDGKKEKIKPKKLIDDVLINDAAPEKVDELLHLMTDNKFKEVDSITFTAEDSLAMIRFIKSKFKVVEAAGGVVDKDGKTLLIFRQGRWDLPKGKLDKKEKKKACAVREVEEETGVKASIDSKIATTWHTYIRNKRYVLKKTYWYAMVCVDDSAMAPQAEEHIDEVRWVTLTELRSALYASWRSVRVVIHEYHRLLKTQKLGS
ncbi:MAG: NUDIX hydrolase [Bacteroidota bacterium]